MPRWHHLPLLLLLWQAAGAGADHAAADAFPVWPIPQRLDAEGPPLALGTDFSFQVLAVGGGAEVALAPGEGVLARAVARYAALLKQPPTRGAHQRRAAPELDACTVHALSASESLLLNTSIAHNITVSPGAKCAIVADTIFGCIAALETFVQLARGSKRSLVHSSIELSDWPSFPHRGVMVDSGRRFWPLPLLRNQLDVMAANKMNVLHLHASDMCRWGVESLVYPELTAAGGRLSVNESGAAAAAGAGFYSQSDIKALVAFAKDRGIHVMPEFE